MRQQVKEGIAAERAHCQGHQEGEQELEAGLLEDGDEHDAQQGQQADDGDGHKTPQPNPPWRRKQEQANDDHFQLFFSFQVESKSLQICRIHFTATEKGEEEQCFFFFLLAQW